MKHFGSTHSQRRWLIPAAVAATTVLAACGSAGETTGSTPTTGGTATSAKAKDVKIGYISLGESVPFVKIVSDSIKAEAKKQGVKLEFCDSALDAAKALDCARTLKLRGVQGVLDYQVFQDSAPEVCAALGDVPVIAIDIVQPPCEKTFFGADDERAGSLAGEAMGAYAKKNWGCDYTAYVSLESTAAGESNRKRMGGYRTGFTSQCPIKNEKVLDGADRTDPALAKMSDLLTALPGKRVVVVGITEDAAAGALAAAKRLDRTKDVFVSGQGTDPVAWKDIACNPQYVASTAFFPQKYGEALVPAIVALINGESVPRKINTKHELVTKDNIRTLYPETPSC